MIDDDGEDNDKDDDDDCDILALAVNQLQYGRVRFNVQCPSRPRAASMPSKARGHCCIWLTCDTSAQLIQLINLINLITSQSYYDNSYQNDKFR